MKSELSFKEKIGQRILKYRKLEDLNQTQLMEKSNLSRSKISEIENGKSNSTIDTYIDIAKALNVVPEALFTDYPEKSNTFNFLFSNLSDEDQDFVCTFMEKLLRNNKTIEIEK